MRTGTFFLMGLLCVAFSATAQDVATRVIPIPQQPFAQPVPEFIGGPATPNPIPARPVPQSPYLAPNGRSALHLDAYQSDTYPSAGPLGHQPIKVNSTFLGAICGTVTFDKQGRIKVLAGTGFLYNSYYSSVYLGPDGKTAYVGVLGGLVRFHENY